MSTSIEAESIEAERFAGLASGRTAGLAPSGTPVRTARLLLALGSTLGAPTQEQPQELRGFIAKNCLDCHDSEARKGELDLSLLPFDLVERAGFARWVRIHDRVRDGEMPPPAQPRPDPEEAGTFLEVLASRLSESELERSKEGRTVLRRLNRYEYENALRDILHAPWLEVKHMLPEDGEAHRFNKAGEALDLSHVQLASYLAAGEQALREVLRSACSEPRTIRYWVREQPAFVERATVIAYNGRPERSMFPMLGTVAQPEVLRPPRREGVREKLEDHPKAAGGLAPRAPLTVGPGDPETRELEAFGTVGGTYTGNSLAFDQFRSPAGGRYRLRCMTYTFWAGPLSPNWWVPDRTATFPGRRSEPVTLYAGSPSGKRRLGSFDATPEPAVHEIEGLLLEGETIIPDAARLFRSRPPAYRNPLATEEGTPGVAYRWLEIEGPLHESWPPPGYEVLFGELPFQRSASGEIVVLAEDPSRAAASLLESFVRAAFRRSASPAEVAGFLPVVQAALDSGSSFVEAMLSGYTAVLCSPGFLFLEQPPGELDGPALASRLSFFLWNSPPDDRSRSLAASGELTRPDALREETERLLDDPRSVRFVAAFLDYWLDLRKILATAPDSALYPDYYLDDLLLESAMEESRLFFAELLERDLPVRCVVDADFTYVNERLAQHYGLSPVQGVAMRRVELPPDGVRGGFLTQASVLKVTANGTTTSPVQRGAWILERILGTVPDPPPPGIPAIEPDTRGAVTIREQLDMHRATPRCAVCHRTIDPPGLALESFDVMGAWRQEYRALGEGTPVAGWGKNGQPYEFRLGKPVDASGRFADGRSFADVREFKRALLADERLLARSLARQLIVYATGTPVRFSDRPELERMLDAAAGNGFGLRTLVHLLVQSRMFRCN
jgi:hypothetical protein